MDKIKEGKTTIKWMPYGRNVVIGNDDKNNEETKRLASVGLIDPKTLSDAERLAIGGISKAAELANKTSEEQFVHEILAVGPEVVYTQVGDKVRFRSGSQAEAIEIDGKYYLQLGEFEVLGKLID